jgi:hypothetical protein
MNHPYATERRQACLRVSAARHRRARHPQGARRQAQDPPAGGHGKSHCQTYSPLFRPCRQVQPELVFVHSIARPKEG